MDAAAKQLAPIVRLAIRPSWIPVVAWKRPGLKKVKVAPQVLCQKQSKIVKVLESARVVTNRLVAPHTISELESSPTTKIGSDR